MRTSCLWDVAGQYSDYASDITRTNSGQWKIPARASLNLTKSFSGAQNAALAALKPGWGMTLGGKSGDEPSENWRWTTIERTQGQGGALRWGSITSAACHHVGSMCTMLSGPAAAAGAWNGVSHRRAGDLHSRRILACGSRTYGLFTATGYKLLTAALPRSAH